MQHPDPGASNRELARISSLATAGPDIPEGLLQVSSYREEELAEVVRVRRELKEPEFTWNTFSWRSEYGSHQRPGYFASVRMHSSRNRNVESTHTTEGYNRHHHADGSNFVQSPGRRICREKRFL